MNFAQPPIRGPNNVVHDEIGTVRLVENKFTWIIDNLVVNLSRSQYGLISPEFANKTAGNTVKWFIKLVRMIRPNGKKVVGIVMAWSNYVRLNETLDIAILNASNDEIFRKARPSMDLTMGNKPPVFGVVPMERFTNRKVSSRNGNKFTLILTCVTKQYSEIERHRASKELSRLDCLNSFAQLANNKQFSDVTLNVQGKELYAYKGILAGRSPVFMAMFSHNMIESNYSMVEINDISYDTMNHLVQYIYTDLEPQFECDESREQCKSLLIAADKYGLEKLKLKLEEQLVLNIQVCNVFEYLNFADSYNAAYLKNEAIEFIISHNDEIAGSEVYKKFNDLHPGVSCEVFRSVLTKRRKLN